MLCLIFFSVPVLRSSCSSFRSSVYFNFNQTIRLSVLAGNAADATFQNRAFSIEQTLNFSYFICSLRTFPVQQIFSYVISNKIKFYSFILPTQYLFSSKQFYARWNINIYARNPSFRILFIHNKINKKRTNRRTGQSPFYFFLLLLLDRLHMLNDIQWTTWNWLRLWRVGYPVRRCCFSFVFVTLTLENQKTNNKILVYWAKWCSQLACSKINRQMSESHWFPNCFLFGLTVKGIPIAYLRRHQ